MRIALYVIPFALTGCAASLSTANEAGGLVSVRGTLNGQAKAMAVADAHCHKFGKVARYEGTNEIRGTVRFECVKP